jgi:ABC-type phosphate transport system permease subunit
MDLYARRRFRSNMVVILSVAAALLGLSWLVMILGTLFFEGLGGLNLAVFAEMTPPPGQDGGLRNAIVGTLLMTSIAVVIGTPIGILAGTYLAEYGRHAKLSMVVRFINDVLLSAPSIVIGLFVYEVMVIHMGHFSAWAGAVALAIIVIPVVLRTTEDMLNLVPNGLREAATALGAPRYFVIRSPQRHPYRHPAGGGAHQRRDGAAVVHRAEQPILEPRSECADGEPAGRHLPVRAEPLRGLAPSCLGGRPADHRCHPRA